MKLKGLKLLAAALCALSLVGCHSCKDEEDDEFKRTVLVYMAGNNNLSGYITTNMAGLEYGFTKDLALENNLVVFIDSRDDKSYLVNVCNGRSDTVRTYQDLNSASGDVLSQIIAETAELYPAESYGLVLWSHGTGWLPSSAHTFIDPYMLRVNDRDRNWSQDGAWSYTSVNPSIRDPFEEYHVTRAFGADTADEYRWMNLDDMADALPDGRFFDFIAFDACLMADAELVYAFRDKCRWMVASAVEIMGEGFPYSQVVENFFNSDYKGLASTFFNYYDSKYGSSRTAGIALIDMNHIEGVASAFKNVVDACGSDSLIRHFDIYNGVQRMDRFSHPVMFDIKDFAYKICSDEAVLNAFSDSLDACIPYCANTPWVVSEIKLDTYCGLSCYIPVEAYDGIINPYFMLTEWNTRTGLLKDDD